MSSNVGNDALGKGVHGDMVQQQSLIQRRTPRNLARKKRFPRIVHYSPLVTGGHFETEYAEGKELT
jgi:hypothetical protein